jgi:hypothetical protein
VGPAEEREGEAGKGKGRKKERKGNVMGNRVLL